MTNVRWFVEEKDAVKCAKAHNVKAYKNKPKSRTKYRHLSLAKVFGFDGEEFKYSVIWRC